MGFSPKHVLILLSITLNLSLFGLTKSNLGAELLKKAERQLMVYPDSALLTLKACQDQLNLTKINELSFQYYYILSAALYETHNYTQSVYILKKLIRDYQSKGLNKNIANAYELLGKNTYKQFEYKQALEYLMKAKDLYQDNKNELKAIACNMLEGEIFYTMEQYYLAEKTFEISLNYAQKNSINALAKECYYFLTKVYLSNKNYNITKAKYYLHKVIEQTSSVKCDTLAELYYKFGLYYITIQQYDSALTFSLKANQSDLNNTLVSKSEVLLTLGIIAKQQGEIVKSKSYFANAISEGNKTSNLLILSEAYKYLADIGKLEGNDSKALLNMQESLLLKDSLIQAKINSAKLENETGARPILQNFNIENFEYQQQKIAQQKILIISLLAVLVLSVSIIILVIYFTRKINQINKRLKRINQSLNEKNRELNKTLSTRDKLISTIAHDIKNPLGIICGFSELIVYQLDENQVGKVKSYANQIFTSTNNLISLLDNLLHWVKSQNYKIRLFPIALNVRNEVDENFSFFEPMANNKNISLRNECNAKHMLYADKITFNTALRNIINNAIKFTELNGIIRINSELSNNTVRIHIQDNGIGIHSDDLPHLFSSNDKQHIGQHPGKGTGIGLNLSYEFVKMNAGTINVYSKPNVGSRFTITLPTHNNETKSA